MCRLCNNNNNEDDEEILRTKITYLNCNNCLLVTNIPYIEELQYLQCKNCPSLSNISYIKGLKSICCINSIKLTNIPHIKSLSTLLCDNCPLLICIPYFEDLQVLSCNNCPKLMYIPIIECSDYDNILLTKPFRKCNYLISERMQRMYDNIYNLWIRYKFYKYVNHLQIKYYSNPKLPYMKYYIENKLYDEDILNNKNNQENLNKDNKDDLINQNRLKIGYINKKNNLIWYNLKSTSINLNFKSKRTM